MIRNVSILLIWVFTFLLIIGFPETAAGFKFLPLALGLIWSFVVIKGWRTLSQLMIVAVYLLATTLLLHQMDSLWVFLSCGAALLAWDLSLFHQTLASVGQVRHRKQLLQKHLFQLTLLMLASSLLTGVGSMINLKLNFVVVAILSLILVWRLKPRSID